jgi:hypothetical protein
MAQHVMQGRIFVRSTYTVQSMHFWIYSNNVACLQLIINSLVIRSESPPFLSLQVFQMRS